MDFGPQKHKKKALIVFLYKYILSVCIGNLCTFAANLNIIIITLKK